MTKPVIALIGLMGAGKSTLGQALARHLGLPFVDLDARIVEQAGKAIPRIFAEDGEDAFRVLESACLEQCIASPQGCVLATGGGVIIRDNNRRQLGQCTVIWLDASPEVLARRVAGDGNRPVLQGDDALVRLRELDRQRRPWYQQCADFRLATDDCTIDEAVARMDDFLRQ